MREINFNFLPSLTAAEIDEVLDGKLRAFREKREYAGPLTKRQRVKFDCAAFLGYLCLTKPTTDDRVLNLFREHCRNANRPVVWCERLKKYWVAHVDFYSCGWELTVDLAKAIYSYHILKLSLGDQIEQRTRANKYDFLRWDGLLAFIPGLDEPQAQALCANLADEFGSLKPKYKSPRIEVVSSKKLKEKMQNMVKFFKDGKALALQTDAGNEQQFTRDFAVALQDYITSQHFEGQHELETWLKDFAEVCCKMRGYKAEVREQRLLTVGEINPASETLINVTEHGTQVIQAVDDKALTAKPS